MGRRLAPGWTLRCGLAALPLLAACGGTATPAPDATAPTALAMDFAAEAVFAAPFPSDHRRGPDGRTRLAGFPGRTRSAYVRALFARAEERPAFSPNGAVFFAATAPLDAASLPTTVDTVLSGAAVFAYPVVASERVRPVPLQVRFQADGGPYGAPNLLSALPVQGVGFSPGAWAVVVTTAVRDTQGRPLAPWSAAPALARGDAPSVLGTAAASYRAAAARWSALGLAPERVAAMTVFTVADVAAEMPRTAAWPAPEGARVAPGFVAREVMDDYCVFEGTVSMPVFQAGEAPYTTDGGRWAALPTPGAETGRATGRVVVTLPRRPMPAEGYPVVMFVRTGGGGDRPLVDRGPRATPGGPSVTAGRGLARDFAQVGFAGISWDGPHGGPRNVSNGDEQFLMFNVGNLGALRDNVRQTALEAALLAEVLPALRLDARTCRHADAPLPTDARFNPQRIALFGHSMGASVAPLAAAASTRFGAVLLSGAGGSYLANVLYKQRPLPVRGAAEALLGYPGTGHRLREDDPALTVLQWALDAADVAPYAAALRARPDGPHVLMQQGIVDRYILPPIANTLSLAWGLDLAGEALDATHGELTRFDPFLRLAPFTGSTQMAGAARGNRGDGAQTAVLRQYAEDGIEDGHEVVFQRDDARRDLRCFLQRWRTEGVPALPSQGEGCD